MNKDVEKRAGHLHCSLLFPFRKNFYDFFFFFFLLSVSFPFLSSTAIWAIMKICPFFPPPLLNLDEEWNITSTRTQWIRSFPFFFFLFSALMTDLPVPPSFLLLARPFQVLLRSAGTSALFFLPFPFHVCIDGAPFPSYFFLSFHLSWWSLLIL